MSKRNPTNVKEPVWASERERRKRMAPLYTLKELRRAIGCSDRLIRQWIRCGLLQGHAVPGHGGGFKFVFTIPEIHAFMARFPTAQDVSHEPAQAMADFRKLYGYSRPFLAVRKRMRKRRQTP